MKKRMFWVMAAVLLVVVVLAMVPPVEAKASLGHPIYFWSEDGTLLDVRYQMGVGYTYAEIEAAFYAFATQPCGPGTPVRCWYGHHVGILKNVVSEPKVVAGFYQAPNGMYYLVDVGQCLIKDGCQP